MANDEDFHPKTKELLAKRAGYQCSVPSCSRITIGPGSETDETSSTGMACHIYSRSKTGPRGQGNLTPKQLGSEDNGIWCCYDHGKLIDNNKGKSYSVKLLKEWKNLHHARLEKNRSGVSTHKGWVDSFKIQRSPLFASDSSIELGQVTHVQGVNGIGKTAVCEWISAYTGDNTMSRWLSASIMMQIDYFTPETKKGELIVSNGKTSRKVDGYRLTGTGQQLSVVYLREYSRYNRKEYDDITKVSLALGLDTEVVVQLIEDINASVNPCEYEIEIEQEYNDEGEKLSNLAIRTEKGTLSINALSGSEYDELLITFATAQASNDARVIPTLLILDSMDRLDLNKNEKWRNYFYEQEFQTLVFSVNPLEIMNQLSWRSYTLERISNTRTSTIHLNTQASDP